MHQRRRWGLAHVNGLSMTPTLLPGDRLLVDYRRSPRPGDLVLARFPDGALVVKRVERAQVSAGGEAGWYLLSDNPDEGVDSRHRGPLPESAVLAVVRRRVWPPLRRPGSSPGSRTV